MALFSMEKLSKRKYTNIEVQIMNETALKIKEIMAKRINIENATLETPLNALDIDSLDLVEAVMDIEEEFGIQFTNEEIQSFKILKDVVDSVESKK